MRLRDRFRKWLLNYLRDEFLAKSIAESANNFERTNESLADLHGKVNHIGTTMEGVLHQVEEILTVLPVIHNVLRDFAAIADAGFAKAQDREGQRRDDVARMSRSLGRLEELSARIHILIAPVIGAPKPKRPPRTWDEVQQTNLDQFEEDNNGPVR